MQSGGAVWKVKQGLQVRDEVARARCHTWPLSGEQVRAEHLKSKLSSSNLSTCLLAVHVALCFWSVVFCDEMRNLFFFNFMPGTSSLMWFCLFVPSPTTQGSTKEQCFMKCKVHSDLLHTPISVLTNLTIPRGAKI